MKRRLFAIAVTLSAVFTMATPSLTSANHADPHLGNSINALPYPDSHNSTYSYYIEVCLASNIGGGPVWDAYGTGFNTQDRIRNAMTEWNSLGGEAHLFASNNCATTDTYITVSYDTYSNFAEFEYEETKSCGVGSGTCWETGILHWNSALNWYVGTGVPAAGWYDAWSMFTHEIGHGMNLGHSSNSAATMYGSLPPAYTFMRSLHGGPCDGSGEYSDVLGYKTYFTCDN